MRRFVVLSGCSCGGKSTLVDALAAEGVATIPEPGRRVVAAALAGDGQGLPWDDPVGFAERALALARDDWNRAQDAPRPVVFDRGMLDAVAAFEHATGRLPPGIDGLALRYDPVVVVVPPWPALFATDSERRHPVAQAQAEYHRLCRFFPRFGYRIKVLPQASVADRMAILRAHLNQ